MREFSNLIYRMIEQKHVHEFDVNNDDDKIIDNFVELIRSLRKFRAIQMKQKLIIFDMSRRH